MDNYLLYFDSGTSNTRAYLLDRDFQVRYVAKKAVGSKDSAIAGSNRVLIEGMKALHDQVLAENGLGEENISAIYASGMITSPYGLKEVPHLPLPLTVKKFADSLYPFREDTCFHREIILVPGLKTLSDDFSFVNNMRGEEIEIIGALEELKAMDDVQDAAMIFPGSHTHVTYVQGEEITGIISNFTGELFYAIQKDTILSPVLASDGSALDTEMVRQGYQNLKRFGFNRALYICHANLWPKCRTVVMVSNEFMYQLFAALFEDSPFIDRVLWMPISESKSYAVSGLKKIIGAKGADHG